MAQLLNSSPPQVLNKNSCKKQEKTLQQNSTVPISSLRTDTQNRPMTRGLKNKFQVKSSKKAQQIDKETINEQFELKKLMTINQLETIELHDMSLSASSESEGQNIDYDNISSSGQLVKLLKLKRQRSQTSDDGDSESHDISWDHGNFRTVGFQEMNNHSIISHIDSLHDILEFGETQEVAETYQGRET